MDERVLDIRDDDRSRAGGVSLFTSGRAVNVCSHTAASTTAAVMPPQIPCRQGAAIGALLHGGAEMELIW
jgi:hypothetical protein